MSGDRAQFVVDDVAAPVSDDPRGERATVAPPPSPSSTIDPDVDPKWAPEDLRDLIDWIRQAYRGAGSAVGGDAGPQVDPHDVNHELVGWMEITDSQARMIAVPMTWWLPVSWIRGGKKGSPLVGAIAMVFAIGLVTKPKIERYQIERRNRPVERADVRDVGGSVGGDRTAPDQDDAHGGGGRDDRQPADDVSRVRPRSAIELFKSR